MFNLFTEPQAAANTLQRSQRTARMIKARKQAANSPKQPKQLTAQMKSSHSQKNAAQLRTVQAYSKMQRDAQLYINADTIKYGTELIQSFKRDKRAAKRKAKR